MLEEVIATGGVMVSIAIPIIAYLRRISQKIDILASAQLANYEANPSLDVEKLKTELGCAGIVYTDFMLDKNKEKKDDN